MLINLYLIVILIEVSVRLLFLSVDVGIFSQLTFTVLISELSSQTRSTSTFAILQLPCARVVSSR